MGGERRCLSTRPAEGGDEGGHRRVEGIVCMTCRGQGGCRGNLFRTLRPHLQLLCHLSAVLLRNPGQAQVTVHHELLPVCWKGLGQGEETTKMKVGAASSTPPPPRPP